MTLEVAYHDLERRFEDMVAIDNEKHGANSVFLPNVVPLGLVDFVLIGSEPSRGRWGKTIEEAHEKVRGGFINFRGCWRCSPLHYCIFKYLCQGNDSYHLTDLAKGAITGGAPWSKNWPKYERWFPLLCEELALVAKPDAVVISIGDNAGDFLLRRGLHGHVGRVPHYSGRVTNHGKFNSVFPREWEEFRSVMVKLPCGKAVSEAQKRWMFDYKVLFKRFRPGGEADWRHLPGSARAGEPVSLRPSCYSCGA